jgi:hypothetical protein
MLSVFEINYSIPVHPSYQDRLFERHPVLNKAMLTYACVGLVSLSGRRAGTGKSFVILRAEARASHHLHDRRHRRRPSSLHHTTEAAFTTEAAQ